MTEPNPAPDLSSSTAASLAESAPVENTRRPPWQWVRWLAGGLLMAALIYHVDRQQFARTLASLSPSTFGLMLLTALVGRLLRAWKWNVLLRAGGIPLSHWQAIRLSLVSHFAGSWTPGQLGGDAYRLFVLRPFGKTQVVLSTLLLERYAGLCAVSFFSVCWLPWTVPYLYDHSVGLLVLVLALILAVAALMPCLFSPLLPAFLVPRVLEPLIPGSGNWGIIRKFTEFQRTLAQFRQYPGPLTWFAIAALAETLSYFVLNYLSARALGLDVSLWFFLAAMPIVHLLLRIPLSVQAVGVQEGCFAYALALHGFTAGQGLAVSMVQRVLEYIVAIAPGALLWWLTPGLSDPQEE